MTGTPVFAALSVISCQLSGELVMILMGSMAGDTLIRSPLGSSGQ